MTVHLPSLIDISNEILFIVQALAILTSHCFFDWFRKVMSLFPSFSVRGNSVQICVISNMHTNQCLSGGMSV